MATGFWQQVRALMWKNFLLKRRHWKLTLFEFLMPLVYFISFLGTVGAFTEPGSGIESFLKNQFYVFVSYLAILPLLYITFAVFINFQVPHESEINVRSNLEIMNVSAEASDIALFLTQQAPVLLMIAGPLMVQAVAKLEKGIEAQNIANNKYLVPITFFNTEIMIAMSVITTRLASGSLLISTQVCQLLQYFMLALFYLVLGRLGIDPFNLS